MEFHMLASRDPNQIAKFIIHLVSVKMMNDLVRSEWPSQDLFCKVAVNGDSSSVDGNGRISLSPDSSFSIGSFFPKVRIAIPCISKIVHIAETISSHRFLAAFDRTKIGIGMLLKFSVLPFNHAFHLLSSLTLSRSVVYDNTTEKKGQEERCAKAGEFRETPNALGEGNPEPSREYTLGRCRDYRRSRVSLITGKSARLERDEIVHSLWKHKVLRYATDADGVSVSKPAACNGVQAAGVAVQTIAAGAYGLVQVYGYHSAVRVRTVTGGSPAVAAGVPLVMQNAVFCLESYATNYSYASTVAVTTNTKFPCAFALAANSTFTTAAI